MVLCVCVVVVLVEGSLEAKLLTTSTHEKASQTEKIRDGESQKREDTGARKGREVMKHRVFQCFVAPGDRKVGSLKRRVRSQLAR